MARVLIIGDTHCPGMRRGYVDFLKRTADRYDVTRVVHIGDLVDWGAISFHEKNPACLNATLEAKEARRQVKRLEKAFPGAEWLLGNHDALPERKAIAAGLPTDLLKGYADYWEINWKVYPRFACLKIDGVSYLHGDSGPAGKDAALHQARERFSSCVIGHLHGQAGVRWCANHDFRVFGMSVGCGIDASRMQFDYGRRFTTKPILSCGVVLDGVRAFVEPWLLPSR